MWNLPCWDYELNTHKISNQSCFPKENKKAVYTVRYLCVEKAERKPENQRGAGANVHRDQARVHIAIYGADHLLVAAALPPSPFPLHFPIPCRKKKMAAVLYRTLHVKYEESHIFLANFRHKNQQLLIGTRILVPTMSRKNTNRHSRHVQPPMYN